MKLSIILILMLFVLVFFQVGFSQTMKVHTNDGMTHPFTITNIDSITFSMTGIPTNGLVGYWPFNGNANDESGNGNHGTVNGATLTTDRFGNQNSAWSFDGVDDFIEVLHDPQLNFGINNFTVCTWIYLNQIPSIPTPVINKIGANPTGPAHGDSYGWEMGPWSGAIYYFNCTTGGSGNSVFSTDTLTAGTWYFMIGRRTSTDVELLLNNALLKATASNIFKNVNNEVTLVFGADIATGDERWLNGKLDDIRIYNRALSDAEIQALFHEGG